MPRSTSSRVWSLDMDLTTTERSAVFQPIQRRTFGEAESLARNRRTGLLDRDPAFGLRRERVVRLAAPEAQEGRVGDHRRVVARKTERDEPQGDAAGRRPGGELAPEQPVC